MEKESDQSCSIEFSFFFYFLNPFNMHMFKFISRDIIDLLFKLLWQKWKKIQFKLIFHYILAQHASH